MTDKRLYDDAEIAEILERATAAQQGLAPVESASGLSLEQIQDIASEVGIDPNRIADAAKSLELRATALPAQRFLGAPVTVSRVVPIERPLTDQEWLRLVTDLRATFGARGQLESYGPLRTWRNGNLHVFVEPDGEAYRVRMHTRKGSVSRVSALAGMAGFFSLLIAVLTFSGTADDSAPIMALAFLLMGLGGLVVARLGLPSWARLRGEQMDQIAERLRYLLHSPAESDPSSPTLGPVPDDD